MASTAENNKTSAATGGHHHSEKEHQKPLFRPHTPSPPLQGKL